MSKASDKIYKQFRDNPDHAPMYLHPNFTHGKQGINKPPKSQKLALAAWRAGRDSMAETQAATE